MSSRRWRSPQLDLDGVEAKQEILAKAAGRSFGVEIRVGGGEHTDVDLAGRRRADALELTGLEHAQQLGLLPDRDVRDFVEKEGTAGGELKSSDAIGARVGKGSLDVAEQLTLKGAFRQSSGINGDQGAMGARGQAMERLRYHLLAGPVLAGDQHVGIGGTNASHELEDGLHCGRGGDELRSAFGAKHADLGLQPLGSFLRAAKLELGPEDGEQARVVPGLLNEVTGSAAHRLDGEIDAAPGGHHDDRDLRVMLPDAAEQIEPFASGRGVARVVEIDEETVELARGKALQHERWSAGSLEVVPLRKQKKPKRLENLRLVVGDQEAAGAGRVGSGVWRHGDPARSLLLHLYGTATRVRSRRVRRYLREIVCTPVRADSIEMEFASSVRPTARSSSILAF